MQAVIAEPLKWWCPNGKQEELIGMITETGWVRAGTLSILFSAANGVGENAEQHRDCGEYHLMVRRMPRFSKSVFGMA